MPKFDKSKRYQNKDGRRFGSGVWLDDSGKLIMPGQGGMIKIPKLSGIRMLWKNFQRKNI